MEQQVNNPLVIRCKNCGGEQSFDIVKQQYVCAHCGTVTGTDAQKAEFKNWKSAHQLQLTKDLSKARPFLCPACGARTMASADDANATCPFCGNTLMDGSFAGTELPEVIIPFQLTLEDAKAKLKAWIEANKSNDAALSLSQCIDQLTGCYLPYQIVRGDCGGTMSVNLQDGSCTSYPFLTYLKSTLVNASGDIDNLFLDGIEPFNFESACEFDFGFLNKQKAKLPNINGDELIHRTAEETESELYHTLSRQMRNKEISVKLFDEDNESASLLLPVYLLKSKGKAMAAVNGQTGKISVLTGKTKNLTGRWWLFPLIATVVLTIIGYIVGDFGLALGLGAVFGIVFFVVAHNRHSDEIINEVLTSPKSKVSHNDTKVQFYHDFGRGLAPTNLKFITFGRILKIVIYGLAITFLPLLIAIPIQILRPGHSLSEIHVGYGAAWYVITGFFAILALGGLAKAMMFGVPIYEEILPDGNIKKHQGKKAKISMKDWFKGMSNKNLDKKQGCLVIGVILFILLGCVMAMLS